MSLITRRQHLPESSSPDQRSSGCGVLGAAVPERTLPDAVKATLPLGVPAEWVARMSVLRASWFSSGCLGVHDMPRALLAPFAVRCSLIILPIDVNLSYSRRRPGWKQALICRFTFSRLSVILSLAKWQTSYHEASAKTPAIVSFTSSQYISLLFILILLSRVYLNCDLGLKKGIFLNYFLTLWRYTSAQLFLSDTLSVLNSQQLANCFNSAGESFSCSQSHTA